MDYVVSLRSYQKKSSNFVKSIQTKFYLDNSTYCLLVSKIRFYTEITKCSLVSLVWKCKKKNVTFVPSNLIQPPRIGLHPPFRNKAISFILRRRRGKSLTVKNDSTGGIELKKLSQWVELTRPLAKRGRRRRDCNFETAKRGLGKNINFLTSRKTSTANIVVPFSFSCIWKWLRSYRSMESYNLKDSIC